MKVTSREAIFYKIMLHSMLINIVFRLQVYLNYLQHEQFETLERLFHIRWQFYTPIATLYDINM